MSTPSVSVSWLAHLLSDNVMVALIVETAQHPSFVAREVAAVIPSVPTAQCVLIGSLYQAQHDVVAAYLLASVVRSTCTASLRADSRCARVQPELAAKMSSDVVLILEATTRELTVRALADLPGTAYVCVFIEDLVPPHGQSAAAGVLHRFLLDSVVAAGEPLRVVHDAVATAILAGYFLHNLFPTAVLQSSVVRSVSTTSQVLGRGERLTR